MKDSEEEEEELEMDVDRTDYHPVAAFAEPLRRKERKGMDFSRWREFVSKPGDSKRSGAATEGRKKQPKAAPLDASEKQGKAATLPIDEQMQDAAILDGERMQPGAVEERIPVVEDMQLDVPTAEIRRSGSGIDRASGGSASLMDEIDAENVARIATMSSDEIAEAQSEILERMNPSLVEMLKKRGWEKSGGKKGGRTDKDKGKVDLGSGRASSATTGDWLPAGVHKGHSWNAWSDRVERVRFFRFSLDGDILEIHSSQEQRDGKKTHGVQSAERVAERDFLRTEGDPAAVGYTINEAIALTRSMVPGQRVLALQLLASILSRALQNLHKMDIVHAVKEIDSIDKFDDWQAVWAYALGPEPQLILSLRMALDDNHDSTVLACAKVIHFVLSYDINEKFFDISEKLYDHRKDICTAPVFRSKPEPDAGFLHGGFWKYNTKPSNILPLYDENDNEEDDEKHTIQDDVIVSGQDVVAGLIRMAILPRICYLLEMDPLLPALEDYLIAILVALARHSPQSADAILRCPRLIQSVIKMLTKQGSMEIHPSQIKGITLLKVLCKYSKQTCLDFVKHGVFQQVMWHWYRQAFTLEDWIRSGKEQCKLNSMMMAEQLRFWRTCISYGLCVAYFTDFFPIFCLWLSPPVFEKLIESDVLIEFCSITREAYLVLGDLAQRLPVLHSLEQLGKLEMAVSDGYVETWSWSHVVPVVELAIQWLTIKDIPYVSLLIDGQNKHMKYILDAYSSSLLWVISAVLHMLSSVLDRVSAEDMGDCSKNRHLPWMPDFVPKIGLGIIDNGFFNFSCTNYVGHFLADSVSLAKSLCYLRSHGDIDASLPSISCLQRLVQLALSVDKVVQRAKMTHRSEPLEKHKTGIAGKILEEGISKLAQNDLSEVLTMLISVVLSEWPMLQTIEIFGRGGPAPGIGFGWGSSGGGFWSLKYLLSQLDSQLVLTLIKIFSVLPDNCVAFDKGMNPGIAADPGTVVLQRISAALAVCLIAGPGHTSLLEKAFDILFQASLLKYLGSSMHYVARHMKTKKSFDWTISEEEYSHFSIILNSHFRARWLAIKIKSTDKDRRNNSGLGESKRPDALETIHEEAELPEAVNPSCNSLILEWAHQRLPLPLHWFLSAICCIGDPKSTSTMSTKDVLDVAKAGLVFVLGLEAISACPSYDNSSFPILGVPLVWKLHSLSMSLHANMDLLQEERSRDIFQALQDLYGQHLDRLWHKHYKSLFQKKDELGSLAIAEESKHSGSLEILGFQMNVHESYSTFVENLVEQFAAISYGDVIFGRQVAIYLHQSVELTVRLAAWNALSSAYVLELLPPLAHCIGGAEGYLEPFEDNEGILEAYAKSWTSGGLDRAAKRESMSFTLAKHHLSCFIFQSSAGGKLALRNKLVKSLIRCFSQKRQCEGMLQSLILYSISHDPLCSNKVRQRFKILWDGCEGNSSLLAEVERLRSSFGR